MAKIGKIETAKVPANAVAQSRPSDARARPANRTQERDFLPAALEILETPANPAGRALALLITALFVIAIAWSVIGKVDVVAVAQGRVVPVGGTKLIQPLEIGIVRSIEVTDGQRVEEGQILVELDPTEREVDVGQLRQKRMEEALEAARLSAYVSALVGEPVEFDASSSGAHETLIRIHQTQLDSDIAAFRAEFENLGAERDRRIAARAALESEMAKTEKIVPLMRAREASINELFLKGLTPKPQWQQARAAMIEAEYELDVQRSRIAEADSSLVAIEKQIAFLVADKRRNAYASLTKSEMSLAQINLGLRKAKKRQDRQILRAPVSGTVQQLQIHTVGGVVQPAKSVMMIVPDDVPVEIRAMILNKDMGKIVVGQPVEIKLEAFNFTKYGTLNGTLASISQDAMEQRDLGLTYEARVSLDSQSIRADGREIDLAPGMSVSVEIKTGERQIIDFLLSPLQRYQDEAIREP